MHWRTLVLLLALTSVGLIAGCGDAGEDASADRSTSADQGVAEASLIQAKDFPSGVKVESKTLSESCHPFEILESDESAAAESQLFGIGQIKAQEAVGVFPAAPAAKSAYDALNAESRLDCVRDQIEIQRVSAEVLPSREVDVGEDAQATLIQTLDPNSDDRNSIEIASIRSGRAVASLIFVSSAPEPNGAVVDNVIDAAAGLLARAR
jgi:hypothetical protein